VISPTTRLGLAALAKAGILPEAEAAALVAGDRLWRAITAHLRLTVGRWPEEALPEPVALALAAATGHLLPTPVAASATIDQPGYRAQMRTVAQQVRESFTRHIGSPEQP
jgi:glutamate-ammonia-ligase adenylyltransferase